MLYNPETVKQFDLCHRFKICTGARYLGGFISEHEFKCDWLQDRTSKQEKNIFMIRKTAGKNTKNYPVVVCAIRSEWVFLQCVTKNMGYAFAGVEKLIWGKKFLPLIWKIEMSPIHCRNSKYDAGQEVRPRRPKTGDVCQWKIPRFSTCKNIIDKEREGREKIFNIQSTPGG